MEAKKASYQPEPCQSTEFFRKTKSSINCLVMVISWNKMIETERLRLYPGCYCSRRSVDGGGWLESHQPEILTRFKLVRAVIFQLDCKSWDLVEPASPDRARSESVIDRSEDIPLATGQ